MLLNVSLPVAELANLKPVHCTVLAGLLAFADRAGRCWPSLRKLAEITGLHLSRVQRAIAAMEEAGILTRLRRGAGTLYQLAERFVRQAIRPKGLNSAYTLPQYTTRDMEKRTQNRAYSACALSLSEPPEGLPHGTANCSASAKVRSASATEGESKKELEEDSKREEGSVRRAAPPVAAKVRSSEIGKNSPVRFFSPSLRPHTELAHGRVHNSAPHKSAAAAAGGPNPFARRQWLRTLNSFIGERLRGQLRLSGWELVTKAEVGEPLARDEQRLLDQIDRAMRTSGYRMTSQRIGRC